MGVNLPARYVFLYDLQRFDGEGFSPLSVNQVWQRAGRAGRPGYDDEGHVVLFAPTWDRNGKTYEKGNFEPIQSQLNNTRALAEQIVTEVGSGLCRTRKQLHRAFERSLAHQQQQPLHLEPTLDDMIEAGMLAEKPSTSNESKKLLLKATPLGRVAVRHLLSPSTVLTMNRFIGQSLSFDFSSANLFRLTSLTFYY
jgi:helicase